MHTRQFVSKSDIRDWPLIGWLCEKGGTIFIPSSKRRGVRHIFRSSSPVFKPVNGWLSSQKEPPQRRARCYPSRDNLSEAALDAKVPVQPYALHYLDQQGNLHPAADFIDNMTFAKSMLSILKAPPMKAALIQLVLVDTTGSHRRELAALTHTLIVEALAQTESVAAQAQA